MLLAVDARNRALSLGFREGGRWLAITRLGISPERSADEYAFFMDAAREKAVREGGGESGGAVESAWISNVVPSFTTRVVEATRLAFGLEAHVVGPGIKTGIRIRTDLPSEVGSDLVCACIAAREIVGTPCIVINFGTVLSFSAVDASGDFVGASFVPGLVSAAETLKASAAQIPDVRIARPERAIGRNTINSVQSGLTIGYGGLVARLVDRMSAELPVKEEGGAVHVVGTGGEEGRAILALEGFGSFIPDLALEGLAIVASRNAS